MITLEDFNKLDLRVAEVISAELHPRAEKLLVMRVRLAGEERQLVAGLRGHYAPEDLVGKHIVMVANLQPAMLRGVESQGMLLAAVDAHQTVIVTPERKVSPGTPVK